MDPFKLEPRSYLSYRKICAQRNGQFTLLAVYDPQNRGSAFVESLLANSGLRVEIEDEGEPVSNPRPIVPADEPRGEG